MLGYPAVTLVQHRAQEAEDRGGPHRHEGGGQAAVDEAYRNLLAVGGGLKTAAILDNFCWGDQKNVSVICSARA